MVLILVLLAGMPGRKRKAGSQRGRPKKITAGEETGRDNAVPVRGRPSGARRGAQRGKRGAGRGSRLCRHREEDAVSHDDVQTSHQRSGTAERGAEAGEVAERDSDHESESAESQAGIEEGTTIVSQENSPIVINQTQSTENSIIALQQTVATLANSVQILTQTVQQLQNEAQERSDHTQQTVVRDVPVRDNPQQDTLPHGTPSESGQSIILNNVEITNRPAVFTGGLRLGDHLPVAIKQKIWDNKYLEFATILDPESEDSFSLSLNNSKQPTIFLTPKRKKFLTESGWIQAFDTYVAVYVQKYPEHLQDLLTYGNSIRKMMTAKQAWWYYDRQFRIGREHSLCSWATVRVDLFMNSEFQNKGNSTVKSFQQDLKEKNHEKEQIIPPGYCFRFHSKGRTCTNGNCSYKHSCPRCGKTHPHFLRCYSPTGNKKNTNFASTNRNN